MLGNCFWWLGCTSGVGLVVVCFLFAVNVVSFMFVGCFDVFWCNIVFDVGFDVEFRIRLCLLRLC